MKSIKLTEKHKSKLLEMCKVLFPEWEEHCIEIDGNSQTIIMFTNYIGGSEWDQIIMHWFEFCMTELVEKILNPTPLNPNRGLQDKFKNFFWKINEYWMHNKFNLNNENSSTKPLHPIDYLYKEFKKLK